MDLREIQRLHAQFAPDSMTIDLPRQIAALPAPVDFAAKDKVPPLKLRLPKPAPAVRRGLMAVAIATVVAMAGMGAASLYHSYGSDHAAHPVGSKEPAYSPAGKPDGNASKSAQSAPRPIDAEPARPVTAAPALSASDLAAYPNVGFTADQFRHSLNGPAKPTTVLTKAAPAVSDDVQRAATSPIHQNRRESAPVQMATPQAQTPAADVSRAEATQPAPHVAAAQAQDTTPASVADHAASTPTASARVHGYRHHVSRPRDEQSADSDAAPAAPKKPAPAGRAVANEVQMF